MAHSARIETEGRSLEIARPDKAMFPGGDGEAITKLDVARYYARVAQYILPHLRGRPLAMQRFPDGIKEEGFFQKRPSEHFPPWLERTNPPLAHGGAIEMLQANDAASLVYLADQGAVAFHPWLSLSENPRHPDQIIWDLDPAPGDDFISVKRAAVWVGGLLRELGLEPFVKTTGSKGLHVVSPIKAEKDFDQVREFAQKTSHLLAARHPHELTTSQRKEERGGRVFLDVMRNALGQTAVAPYSLRPLPGAPLAAPLDWEELERGYLNSRSYNLANIFRRLGQKADPWKQMHLHARRLDEPASRLELLLAAET